MFASYETPSSVPDFSAKGFMSAIEIAGVDAEGFEFAAQGDSRDTQERGGFELVTPSMREHLAEELRFGFRDCLSMQTVGSGF